MVNGSAPVLVSAFGASADTSRRQEMKIGDLVRVKKKLGEEAVGIIMGTYDFADGSYYWRIMLGIGREQLADPTDVEVINASR
jgi:hypothetical protein|tara:strand:+ start:399 stop:647 length:249 start_codon:yes stop_codon:yes gene_type:complete